MIENNHHSLSQTMAYGYQSLKDEADHLGSIADGVLQQARGLSGTKDAPIEPKAIPERKYSNLEKQPLTRIIPRYGICCNTSCSSRFEQCFQCKHFVPDPLYLEYFEQAIVHLQKKIAMLPPTIAARA